MLELLITEFMLRGFCDTLAEANCTTDSFVEIYNNSDQHFDQPGWRLEYRNATAAGEFGATRTVLAELDPLAPHSFAVLPTHIGNATRGYLLLINDDGQIIDLIGYGRDATIHTDNQPAPAPARDRSATRCTTDNRLTVSGLNSLDFLLADPTPGAHSPCPATSPPPTGSTTPPASDQPSETHLCSIAGLHFTEFYTNFAAHESEQFIEIYNSNSHAVSLLHCQLHIKFGSRTQIFTFGPEIIEPHSYFALFLSEHDLRIARDPTSSDTVRLVGITTIASPGLRGQKSGRSFALIDDTWHATLNITPNSANVLQHCPIPQIQNPATGRCINPPTTPLPKECDDGYELNPLTNRCRLIRNNTGAGVAYGLPDTGGDPGQRFVATSAVIAAVALSLLFTLFHFRKFLARPLHRLAQPLRRLTSPITTHTKTLLSRFKKKA
ncbi:lamin tail domain-containing protein [Candidatus Saccharibacteria bacterium]|nr:lamin tail domain-containing protein [Candidatus Saccharibacteria bacterium]